MRLRSVFTGALTGALLVGSVWAGVGLTPVTGTGAPPPVDPPRGGSAVPRSGSAQTLGNDEVLAGAAKISIEPQPPSPEAWVRDRTKCAPVSDKGVDPEGALTHAADPRTPWIENTNCIYMGGYGLGPLFPVTSWDATYGLWVRSVALSDGTDTIVLTLLDGTYYFGKYARLCSDCGFFDLAQQLGAELKLDPSSFIFSSTHSHTAPDFIGGWGGVPGWYMQQVADALRASVRQAVAAMRPATLIAGDTLVRERNRERRDTYRSAEDPTLNWFRAVDGVTGATVATVGAYAAHPITADENTGVAHGDYHSVFAQAAETRFGGGVGLLFPSGLGNMSPSGSTVEMGEGLAARLPDTGTPVIGPDVRVKQEFWDQPVTNQPLGRLGQAGFFDRPFEPRPAVVTAGKSGVKPCTSASEVSVRTAVTAAKVGQMVITGAPGEIFANYSNTIEERSPLTALAIGLANDGLGYIVQSFETDHVGRQGTGFVGGGVVEYEDAYSIDACFGDKALETTLALLGRL